MAEHGFFLFFGERIRGSVLPQRQGLRGRRWSVTAIRLLFSVWGLRRKFTGHIYSAFNVGRRESVSVTPGRVGKRRVERMPLNGSRFRRRFSMHKKPLDSLPRPVVGFASVN